MRESARSSGMRAVAPASYASRAASGRPSRRSRFPRAIEAAPGQYRSGDSATFRYSTAARCAFPRVSARAAARVQRRRAGVLNVPFVRTLSGGAAVKGEGGGGVAPPVGAGAGAGAPCARVGGTDRVWDLRVRPHRREHRPGWGRRRGGIPFGGRYGGGIIGCEFALDLPALRLRGDDRRDAPRA